ncbi:MAG: L-threonine 3-dehydrogenase [Tissierellia bacterium]|nr:L-threonine 3-dehydrogenase [Tissierellia bacterium]
MRKILVTGALGQIGSELVLELRRQYGNDNVIASNRSKKDGHDTVYDSGPFELLDIRDGNRANEIIDKYKINTIINLAAILSAVGEQKPTMCWDVNMNGLYTLLEIAREKNLMLFNPSSIAAFGPSTPADQTPQDTIQRPTSMYGVTKVAGEILCDYYHQKFGVDTRGVRFPGLISNDTLPGGGTTDYAVHIYYEAIRKKSYTSFIRKGTKMDMMYMPDAIKSIVELMEADPTKLVHRNAFNITAMSVAPEDIEASIKKFIPEFTLDYDVDPVRQAIADSWPNSLDASAAKAEWGYEPDYDLDKMTKDMLDTLSEKLK